MLYQYGDGCASLFFHAWVILEVEQAVKIRNILKAATETSFIIHVLLYARYPAAKGISMTTIMYPRNIDQCAAGFLRKY